MKKFTKNIDFHLLAISLILSIILNVIIATIFFVFHSHVSEIIFPLSVFLSVSTIYFSARKNIYTFISTSAALLLIIFTSIFVSTLLYDYSWDGQWYHQDIIIGLMNGWNPFFGHLEISQLNTSLCVNHYARGLETVAACIGKFTGNVESGKATLFIIFTAGIILFYEFLNFEFKFLTKKKKIFIAFIFNLCPVVMTQFFTYYIDWSIYIFPIILIILLIIAKKNNEVLNHFAIALIVSFLVSIKFNFLFWTLFLLFFYSLYLIISKKFRYFFKIVPLFFIAIIIGVFFVSYQPYIKNYKDHGHVFFPLMGNDESFNEQSNTQPNLQNLNRFKQVLISYTSLPVKFSHTEKQEMKSALLFQFTPASYSNLGKPDIRIGGFGWFFAWIFIFSTLLYIRTLKRKNKHKFTYLGVILVLLSTPFILPFGWWARFVPFLYATPLIMVLYTENWQEKYLNTIRKIIYSLIIVNILVMFLSQIRIASNTEKRMYRLLNVLSESKKTYDIDFGDFKSFKFKMDKYNISYNEVVRDSVNFEKTLEELWFKKTQLKMIYTHPGVKFISLEK